MEEFSSQEGWVDLIVSVITVLGSIIVAVITGIYTVRSQIKSKASQLLNDAEKDYERYLSEVNPQGVPIVSEISEFIKPETTRELTRFVENNRIRLEILSVLKAKIPTEYYYNFAVYYAFIRSDFKLADFFIDKALGQLEGSDEEVKILRWAARINRLNHNEGEASHYLTKLIKIIEKQKNDGSFDRVYVGRLLRSRGFSSFNQFNYEGAIADFERALSLTSVEKDFKAVYCHCGLAYAKYRLQKKNPEAYQDEEILRHFLTASGIETLFVGNNSGEVLSNLKILESDKKYYFSQYEKDTLLELNELYRNRRT